MSQVHRPGASPSALTYVFSTLGGLGPLLALWLVERLTSGAISLKATLGQVRFRGARLGWLLTSALFYLAITLASALVYALMERETPLRLIQAGPDGLGWAVLPVMAIHFIASLVTSPLFEEPGWRGFALPWLQARLGGVGGSLVVGLLWWLWHQPMNWTFGLLPTVSGLVAMVTLSFIIDSLYNLSGGNLLAAMLAHQSLGTALTFLYSAEPNWTRIALLVLLAAALRVTERLRRRQRASLA
jgi:hypothetical protein